MFETLPLNSRPLTPNKLCTIAQLACVSIRIRETAPSVQFHEFVQPEASKAAEKFSTAGQGPAEAIKNLGIAEVSGKKPVTHTFQALRQFLAWNRLRHFKWNCNSSGSESATVEQE